MSCVETCLPGTGADRTTNPNNLTCKVFFRYKIFMNLRLAKYKMYMYK